MAAGSPSLAARALRRQLRSVSKCTPNWRATSAIGIVPDSARRTASRWNCSSNARRPRRHLSPPASNLDRGAGGVYSTGGSPTPVSGTTSHLIATAAIEQPEWTYTQNCFHCDPVNHPSWTEIAKDLPNHKGDCTDFVWTVVRSVLGSTQWPFGIARTVQFAAFTSTTAAQYGYVLTDSADVRYGDVIVRVHGTSGGHAGIFEGWGQGGHPIAWANNGLPASSVHPNFDGTTGYADMIQKTGYTTLYFRPATKN